MIYLKNLSTRQFLLVAVILSLLSVLAVFISPVYSDWNGDIDDVTQELDQDFKFGGKEDIKSENLRNANEQLREDTQIENNENNTLSPLSGTYTLSGVNFTYEVFKSGKFTAKGVNPMIPTFSFSLVGTVVNNISSFTITLTETTGPPTNFPVPCTDSTSTTGVFTGAGEPGTTHIFSREFLCSNTPGLINIVHTKQ